jgi:hypothetical protein
LKYFKYSFNLEGVLLYCGCADVGWQVPGEDCGNEWQGVRAAEAGQQFCLLLCTPTRPEPITDSDGPPDEKKQFDVTLSNGPRPIQQLLSYLTLDFASILLEN